MNPETTTYACLPPDLQNTIRLLANKFSVSEALILRRAIKAYEAAVGGNWTPPADASNVVDLRGGMK